MVNRDRKLQLAKRGPLKRAPVGTALWFLAWLFIGNRGFAIHEPFQSGSQALLCPSLLAYHEGPRPPALLVDKIAASFHRESHHLSFLKVLGHQLEKINPVFSAAKLEKYWLMPKGASGKAVNGAHLYSVLGHHLGGMAYAIEPGTITVYHQYLDSIGLIKAMGLEVTPSLLRTAEREILLREFLYLRSLKPKGTRSLKLVWNVPLLDPDQKAHLLALGFQVLHRMPTSPFANTPYEKLERLNTFSGDPFLDRHDNWTENPDVLFYNRSLHVAPQTDPGLRIYAGAGPQPEESGPYADSFPPPFLHQLGREYSQALGQGFYWKAYLQGSQPSVSRARAGAEGTGANRPSVGAVAGAIQQDQLELAFFVTAIDEAPMLFTYVRLEIWKALQLELKRRNVKTIIVRQEDFATQIFLRTRLGLELDPEQPEAQFTQPPLAGAPGYAFALGEL
jgi:hypothetical protein